MKSERVVEEFLINPNLIKQLRQGEAALLVKHPEFFANVVQLDFPQPRELTPFFMTGASKLPRPDDTLVDAPVVDLFPDS